MINAIIVDDEPLALDVLETYINQLSEINLVARCENALQANEVLKNNQVDLMFLDIQMPQLTGTDFLKTLDNPPLVIFTTAYANYAVEGFELNAIDYLLKPISLERFMKASNKAIARVELENKEQPSDTGSNSTEDGADFIFVKSDKRLVKIHFSDMIYVEGLKDYVIIRLANTRVITLQTMKSLEVKLPQDIFKRIHRSYIVNIQQINAVVGNMIEVIEKGKPKHIPIGKNYREEILEIVNRNRL